MPKKLNKFQQKIENCIDKKDHVGLKALFEKNYDNIESLIPPATFIKAFDLFLNSDAENIADSYKVIELLNEHFYDKNRQKSYQLAGKYDPQIYGLFNLYDKVKQHKPLNLADKRACEGIDGFDFNNYKNKFDLYEEKNNQKNIHNKLDIALTKELSQLKHAALKTKVANKSKPELIEAELNNQLMGLLETLRNSVVEDAKFKDHKNQLLFTDIELNQIIYERLSHIAPKALELEQATIDKLLRDLNTQKMVSLHEQLNPESVTAEALENNLGNFKVQMSKLIPPHLVDIASITPYKNENEIDDYIKSNYTLYQSEYQKVINTHYENLKQQVKLYQDKPGKEEILEETLKELIRSNINLNQENKNKSLTKENKKLNNQLEQVKEIINNQLLEQHNKKSPPSNELTAFEKRAISIFATSKDNLSSADKKILGEFFANIQDNKEFGSRIEKIIKNSNNDFNLHHLQTLQNLQTFHKQTLNIDQTINIVNKGKDLTEKEMAAIKNLIEAKDLINFLREAKIFNASDKVQKLIKTFDRAYEYNLKANPYVGSEAEIGSKGVLDAEKIKKYIEKSNSEKLKSYLNKNFDNTKTLLPAEIYISAFTQFLKSDARSMGESYKIIEILNKHFFDPNRAQQYQNSNAHSQVYKLFNLDEKVRTHQSLKENDLISAVKDFTTEAFEKKFALHEEKQNLRNVYKAADNSIEKNFIYTIKYPGGTHFVRKLLNIPPKRNGVDIENDFNANMPKFIESLRTEIANDPKFKDKNGNLLLTEAELSQAIYERLSLKATKQLGLSQDTIDKFLVTSNTEKLSDVMQEIADNVKNEESKLPALAIKFQNLLVKAIPPHLIDLDKIKLGLYSNLEKENQVYRTTIKDAVKHHISSLERQVAFYSNKPGREHILEKTLKNILSHNARLQAYSVKAINYDSATLTPSKIEEYEKLLNQTQEKINANVISKHSTNKRPKNKLTEFEVRAIELYAKRDTIEYSEADKKLLAEFFKYAHDNKEFNTRLGNILKTNNEFVKRYSKGITKLHKFTHKTSHLNNMIHNIDKIQFILDKLQQEPNYKFNDKEKITLLELGGIGKFLEIEGILKFMQVNEIYTDSNAIQELIKTYFRAAPLMSEYFNKVEQAVSYEEGDLVMHEAKKYHDLNRHKSQGFRGWVQDVVITPYSHAAIGTRIKTDEGKKSGVAEVWDNFQRQTTDGANALISETFRVYPDSLLQDKEMKNKVIEAFGIEEKDLKEFLHEKYRKIAKGLNNNESLEGAKIKNSHTKREKAGFADFKPFGHRGKESVRSWADKVLEDRENLGHKIKDPNGKGYIICSEYAAKMTVLALVELEKELIDKIKEKEPDLSLPKSGVLKLPFHDFEDLNKVHPARLIKKLSEVKAIEKVPELQIIQDTVKFR